VSALLEVRGVTKSFGSLRALDGVSMNIESKKLTMVIGPNGSGKTTLVNVIDGQYRPDAGSIIFDGKDITKLAPYERYAAGIARTFQIPSLFWKLSVLENLLVVENGNPGESFAKSLAKSIWVKKEREATDKAFRLLEFLGMKSVADQLAVNLSGGQMKLLEIGRIMMSGAKLALLDEPISGVNPSLAHEIFASILRIRDELEMTFFIIEHRLDIATSYVDDVVAISSGRVIAEGKPEEVLTDPKVVEAYLGQRRTKA
jgi:branched-chain amino acid transport system ATP-binding protein